MTVVKRLRSWNWFSGSSPVESISRAIRNFAAEGTMISIYVVGEECLG